MEESMPEKVEIKAKAYPTQIKGRIVCSSDNHHFVQDEPSFIGGPGEEVGAGHHLLFGVCGCGVGLVEMLAEESGVSIDWMEVNGTASLDMKAPPVREDRTVFHFLELNFSFKGIEKAKAEELVEEFKKRCPMFGTVSASIPDVRVNVSVE